MDKIISELKEIYLPKHIEIIKKINNDDLNSIIKSLLLLDNKINDPMKLLENFINNENNIDNLLTDNVKNIIYDNYGYYFRISPSELFSVFENISNELKHYDDKKLAKIYSFFSNYLNSPHSES